MIELGLGLIGIEKPWGHRPGSVPDEKSALDLLANAYNLGIRHFDTAASYGLSEERVGRFLKQLTAAQRDHIFVATKFGEHWHRVRQEPFVDHSYDALRRSLDTSLERLGRIDLLQLHKTTPAVLRSDDVRRAIAYAKSLGVPRWGASVSDPESAAMAVADRDQSWVQLPFNMASPAFGPSIDAAAARGMRVAVNRPFAMGAMLYAHHPVKHEAAFRFILGRGFEGVVLTGTKSVAHLRENIAAFARAAS
jgi:aryl-alcohol dehydrogenase-like predicted oxidoreductase